MISTYSAARGDMTAAPCLWFNIDLRLRHARPIRSRSDASANEHRQTAMFWASRRNAGRDISGYHEAPFRTEGRAVSVVPQFEFGGPFL